MATTIRKFSKIFRGSMPPAPPRVFFILNMLQNNSAGKKLRLKICHKCGISSLKENFEYAADMKTFFKRLIYTFFGSNVFVYG